MKYVIVFIIIGFLFPKSIYSQNLEVEGTAVIKIMTQDNAANLIVVKQADGTLAVREASTLTDGDSDPMNEIQDLSIDGDILTLTLNGSATEIDLSGYLDNTDAQQIDVFELSSTLLYLSIAGDGEASKVVDLSTLQDGTGTDDQTLTEVLSENNDAGGLKISGLMDPGAAQDAATKAYVDAVQSDVDTNEAGSDAAEATLQTNIDNEATRAQTAEAANATSISNHIATDLDISATNELNSTILLDGTDLKVTDAGGTITTDLSSLKDGTGTDDQTLTEILSENNDAGGLKIGGLMDPVAAQDAATMAYVDNLLISFGIALGPTGIQGLLIAGHASVSDLLAAGVSVSDLLAAGASVSDLLAAGASVSDLLAAGVSVSDLLAAGASVSDLLAAGVSVSDLLAAGASVSDLLTAGVSVQSLLDANQTPLDIYNGGVIIDSLYGKTYQGGLIFYFNTTTGEGYVAAPTDQSSGAPWGCIGTDLQNVPNVQIYPPSGPGAEIGDGSDNTTNILNDCPSSPAALACSNYTGGGFSDWFLPSILELVEMYNKIGQGAPAPNTNIGGFTALFYWSSSEDDDYIAWKQEFFNGSLGDGGKNGFNRVRAIRAF